MDELVTRGKRRKIVQAGATIDRTDDLREACQSSLYCFAKAVMGMKDFTTQLHLPLCNWLQGNQKRKRIMLIPRSCFKTSMARCLGMHITIQEPVTNLYFAGRKGCNLRILFAAETEKRAMSRIGWIRRQYETNDLLKVLWPHLIHKSSKQAPTWTVSHFSLPRDEDYPEATFEAAGVDSGSTGSHYDVLIKDDLIGLRCRKMPELIPSAIEWFQTSHSLTDNMTTYLDYVFGTRWAPWDLYTWMEENEHAYEWCVKQIINDKFEAKSIIFPERFTVADLEDLKKKQGELFWLNYMNRVFGDGNTAFDMTKALYCKVLNDHGYDYIEYEEDQKTAEIMEIIESGNKLEPKPQPKKLWELTPQERNERWQEAQRNYYQNRATMYERT